METVMAPSEDRITTAIGEFIDAGVIAGAAR
jgi:hypothetical protein